MKILSISIYDAYIDKRKPREIFCSGCIILSSAGSIIYSRSPFEALEGSFEVINETKNLIYVPLGTDVAAMAEALFSIGGLNRLLNRSDITDFFEEKLEDYSGGLSVFGQAVSNISLCITRGDMLKRLIVKHNDVRSVSILLEDLSH